MNGFQRAGRGISVHDSNSTIGKKIAKAIDGKITTARYSKQPAANRRPRPLLGVLDVGVHDLARSAGAGHLRVELDRDALPLLVAEVAEHQRVARSAYTTGVNAAAVVGAHDQNPGGTADVLDLQRGDVGRAEAAAVVDDVAGGGRHSVMRRCRGGGR